MSRRCTKCGSFLTDSDRFCPGCGENAPVETSAASAFDSQQYNANNFAPPPSPAPYTPNSAPQYNPYQYQAPQEEMTVGKWLLTIFVTSLGCIGLIFLFVWGFGDGPKARQNYCKAMLIFSAIAVALVILYYIFIIAVVGVTFSELANEFDYSSIEMAASFMSSFIK